MAFEVIVETMMEMTVFQLFFPWLVVLAVTYGVLENYKVISDDDSVNGVIALAIAFMAVGGSYLFIPAGFLSHVVAALTFTIFAVIGLMIVMAIAGYDLSELSEDQRSLPYVLGVSIFLIGLIAILPGYLPVGDVLPSIEIEDPQQFFDDFVLPIAILFFLLAIVGMTLLMGDNNEEDEE